MTTNNNVSTSFSSVKQWKEEQSAFYSQNGLPTRKHEEYKYMRTEELVPFLETKAVVSNIAEYSSITPVTVSYNVVTGEIHTQNTIPSLSIQKLTNALLNTKDIYKEVLTAIPFQDPFQANHIANFTHGIVLESTANSIVETIHIEYIIPADAPNWVYPTVLVIANENSELNILESYKCTNVNPVIIVENKKYYTASNSILKVHFIQNFNMNTALHSSVQFLQATNSKAHSFTVTLGGKWVRNNLTFSLKGEYAESYLQGLYFPSASNVIDNHTLVQHLVPNCYSMENYKGIIQDKGTAVFNGKIFVAPDAQKTNAYQSNKNILLSKEGSVNTKPQLEIFANDVKCSHGSSTGTLDPDMLFYMQARGIELGKAKKMLIVAMIEEIIQSSGNTVEMKSVIDYITHSIL